MKKIVASLFALGLSMALNANANAISIDVRAHQPAVNLGDSVEVQVRISGLNEASAPSLGVYDVKVDFDATLFSFNSLVWGDASLGNQLDIGGFGSLQDSNSGAGWLSAFELSFDDALDLQLLQREEFTLFSIFFSAIAIGSGDFSLTANALGDAYGSDLLIDTINNTRVKITGVSVPEPSSLLLLLGVIAFILLRSKLSHSRQQ